MSTRNRSYWLSCAISCVGLTLALMAVPLAFSMQSVLAAEAQDDTAVENRIADAAKYLASDELEGRGLGEKGLDVAASYVAQQFAGAGLKTELFNGTALQKFNPPRALKPKSDGLLGWLVDAALGKPVEASNVLGVLEGEGPLADETLVIGAHYDHLGIRGRRPTRGTPKAKPSVSASSSATSPKGEVEPASPTAGASANAAVSESQPSAKPDEARESAQPRDEPIIYNGADDNASGVAVMIEIARELAARPEKLRRRVVFIAFSGEERGLLGSAHYVANPLISLDKTIAMLNLDMVGRLREDKLTVFGTGTASGFPDLLDRVNTKYGLTLINKPSGIGPSDHASFYRCKIPVLHFFTEVHENLHRPSDDFETLNLPGMRRIARFVLDVTVALANAETRPEYQATDRSPVRAGHGRPFFGSIGNLDSKQPGYAISDVVEGSPAQRAGLRGNDVIVELNDQKIGSFDEFAAALEKHKEGDQVKVTVRRGQETLRVEVTLDAAR